MEQRRVFITRRTANSLINASKRYYDLERRFRQVGSNGRADKFHYIAETMEEIGQDLMKELNLFDKNML